MKLSTQKAWTGLIALVVVLFLSTLVFVSLLGENNKIDAIITSFFKDIQTQNYFSAEQNLKTVADLEVFDMEGEFSDNCFLLELALLQRFNLTESPAYSIELERDVFWIPFIRPPSVKVSIALHPGPGTNLLSYISPDDDRGMIANLFTMRRMDGVWRIAAINIGGSELFPHYNSFREQLALEDSVQATGDMITVSPLEVDTSNATIFEKRRLSYIFHKVNHLISRK